MDFGPTIGSRVGHGIAWLTHWLDLVFGKTLGTLIVRGASKWTTLAQGTANQILVSAGAAALPAWTGLSALFDTIFGSTVGTIITRGSSGWTTIGPGSVGQELVGKGSGVAPAFLSIGTGGGPCASGNPQTTSLYPTYVMGGMDVTFTPARSGTLLVVLTGQLGNLTAGRSTVVQMAYGTGTPPSAGAAATGTLAGGVQGYAVPTASTAVPFPIVAIITGLTIGTTYWFDFQQATVSAGTAFIASAFLTIVEL